MAFPSLVLGAFNLTDWSGSTYQTQVIAEGTSKGSPMPIEVAVKSWLQDGSIVATQGYDNRTVTLRVKLRGLTLTAVAQAEAALFAELGKPNKLTWTPASGPAAVFMVVTSSMDLAPSTDEDIAEGLAAYPWRTYNIRLLCEAFTRSASETTVTVLAGSGTTTTLVNDGSATTSWTGSVSGGVLTGPTVVSGAVKVGTTAAVSGAITVSATLTTAITTSSTKYLVIDWKPESNAGSPDLRAYGDGTELQKIAQSVSPTAGYTRSTFQVGAAVSSIAALRLDELSTIPNANADNYNGEQPVIRSLYVDNINRSDIKPFFGTSRQTLRIAPVSGSARSQPSIAVEHSTNALGDVFAYFYPASSARFYTPPMRQYHNGGGTVTADATLMSGSREPVTAGPATTFGIPVAKLASGSHVFVMRLLSSLAVTSATINYSFSMGIAGGGGSIGSTVSGSVTTTLTTTYTNVVLGRVVLPVLDLASDLETTVVNVVITGTSAATITLDEAWLFNTDIGQLVMVGCGSNTAVAGGSSRRLFLEPPTITRPRPLIRVGHSADRSDAYFPQGANASLTSWQLPQLLPPDVAVFLGTSNALDPTLTLRGFARWYTNPAS